MSKLCSLYEAVSKHVVDGDLVYAAGFTHLIPFAAGHEIIRQKKKDLVLARATPDLIYDQMIAAGCARKIIFSYKGNPGVGSLRIARKAIENGILDWEEYSHFGMISRLQAGATGLPFIPMNQTAATDLEKVNPNYKHVTDPYSGKDVIVLPPLNPDVAIIHVQRADANGNAHVWGILGEQKEAAFASQRVIITAEEIVDESIIRSDPNRTLIPGFIVDAVCHVPFVRIHLTPRVIMIGITLSTLSGTESAVQRKITNLTWMSGFTRVKDRNQYLIKLGEEIHARLKVKTALQRASELWRILK